MPEGPTHPISQAVLAILQRLLGTRLCLVGRLVGESFVVHEGVDLDRGMLSRGAASPVGETLAALAAASRGPVIRGGEQPIPTRFEGDLGARSALVVPVFLGDGTVIGTIAAMHRDDRRFGKNDAELAGDLARAVAAEMEETIAVDRAVELERARLAGLLARGLAHDFGNIVSSALANLRSVARILDEHPELREAREPIDELKASLEAGRELIARLRDVGRTDQKQSRRRGIDPTAVASKVVAMARGLFGDQSRGAWIDLRLVPPDFPLEIRGDEHAIEQALLNLVLNARDAVGPRGGRVTVRVLQEIAHGHDLQRPWQTPGQWALLAVDDDGPGIDARVRARIFEPGFTTKGDRGSGLGLFFVKMSATAHGGGVLVDRSPEGGARVAIALPATQRGSATGFRPPMVLVADDERGLRRACARELAAAGLGVAEAADRASALEIVEADPKRIVAAIIDRDLGDGSGEDVARRLRALNPSAFVVETSGADVEGVLEKPFDLPALVESVLAAVRAMASRKP
ncbi:MAG: GAF domain-containing protein [Deltaproteobacteria bacterium]|nr:GAF domain-containing protein [Deltaproteobacteria bacterium]